jgi:hypothetical protein
MSNVYLYFCAIIYFQVHLIELKRPFDYDELINLIAEELVMWLDGEFLLNHF